MRTPRLSVRCASALALLSGGLWAAPAIGQQTSSTNRSVYDRTPSESSSALAPAEPRRLPSASTQRPLNTTPKSRRRRPQGYLSQGLSDARTPVASSPNRRLPAAGPAAHAPATAMPSAGTAKPAASQGVIPAFFPAPLSGTSEAPRTAAPSPSASQQIAVQLNNTAPGEHPLAPAVRWAKLCMQKMDGIKDYSAKMAKRERIDGALTEYEYLYVKVRHEPFSVYLAFIGPARVKGQEAIYVKGRNNGNLMAHATGVRKIFGTVSLKPDSMLAMTGNRYPITELGIKRLTERLIEVGDHDAKFDECTVKATANVKINGRECVCLQVNHPTPRAEFLFSKAKIYVDSQYNVPVRYEAYDWPREPGGEPLLVEEYTYFDLKINNGFTDRDFDVANPEYQFR